MNIYIVSLMPNNKQLNLRVVLLMLYSASEDETRCILVSLLRVVGETKIRIQKIKRLVIIFLYPIGDRKVKKG